MGSATVDSTAAGYRKWARDPNIESGLGCGGRSQWPGTYECWENQHTFFGGVKRMKKLLKRGSLVIGLALALSLQTEAIGTDEYREAIVATMDKARDALSTRSDYSHGKAQRAAQGDWRVVVDSPSEGFVAATLSTINDEGLTIGCLVTSTGRSLWASAVWPERNALGTYYSDIEYQPVTLNWRRPNLTQNQQWRHLSGDSFDGVIIGEFSGEGSEIENLFTRLPSHTELEVVVETRPGGATRSALFQQLAGAPIDRARQACGDASTATTEPEPVGTGPTLIFPQWVNGVYESSPFPNRTRLILRNLAGEEDPVTVTYFGGDGEVVNNETYTVPGRGTVDVWSDGRGNFVMGALTVDSDLGAQSQLRGTVVYELLGQRVSIPAAELVTEAEVFLSKSASENTSLVLYNPNSDPLELEFVMYTSQGRPFWRLYVTLEPDRHLARFMDEDPLFSAYFRRRTEFTGHVVVSSEGERFAVMSLLHNNETGAMVFVKPAVR